MRYGVSYYPEHKESPQEIESDISLIQDAGYDFVRMAEFAWCKFEPEEGKYEFDWLDGVINRLGSRGIQTIVCTPTACPPSWLAEKYPEIFYTDNRGFIRPFGGRRQYCYNNPVYREYSRKIALETVLHYSGNPYVFGFQIDNELAQEGTGRCHCTVCKEKFRVWLKDRYKTIEALNIRMGTIFWGQTYKSFDQINLPVNTIEVGTKEPIESYYDNPSLRLDFERFCSESLIEYQNIQGEVLKKNTNKIVTTNATGLATNSVDYYQAYEKLDVYGFDYYPSLRDEEISSFPYAFARGIRNQSFWLLEFVSGGGHRLGGSGRLQAYPGALKQSVIHAFASGASLVAHFQFKTFNFGAEQLNYAILDADGVPRRRFFEAKEASDDIRKLEHLLGASDFRNEIALCFDYNVLWALKIKPINQGSFDYLGYCSEIYDELLSLGVNADVISYSNDIKKYKALILPCPFILDNGFKERLKDYVKNGGTLLTTFLAGAKNQDNNGINESLPCDLTDLFGICVGEVEPVFDHTISEIALHGDKSEIIGKNKYWTEQLENYTAEIIGTYNNTFRKGEAVVSKNIYGLGKAYYLGTGLESKLLSYLLSDLVKESGIERVPFKTEKGIEIISREFNGRKLYCVFNFLKKDVSIESDRKFTEIKSGETVGQVIKIRPKGYVFLLESLN